MIRLYVDFNTMMMDEQGRVYIGTEGSTRDDQNLLKSLRSGASVVLYDEEMEVQARVEFVEFSREHKAWLGEPDWSTRRDRQYL